MKKTPEYSASKDYLYAMFMADELRAIPREKKTATAVQAASTQAILDRPKEKDAEHFWRPLPENWVAVPGAKTDEERVGARPITLEEMQLEDARRRRPKNTLGDAISLGASGVSPDRVANAISAYTCSPPAELSESDKLKLRALAPYAPLPEIKEEPAKNSWVRRIFPKKKKYGFKLVAGRQTPYEEDE